MSDAVLQSPLAPLLGAGDKSLVVDGQAVVLGEAPLRDMLNLRGNPADAALCSAVQTVTGLALPLVANTASVGADRQLLWLGRSKHHSNVLIVGQLKKLLSTAFCCGAGLIPYNI